MLALVALGGASHVPSSQQDLSMAVFSLQVEREAAPLVPPTSGYPRVPEQGRLMGLACPKALGTSGHRLASWTRDRTPRRWMGEAWTRLTQR